MRRKTQKLLLGAATMSLCLTLSADELCTWQGLYQCMSASSGTVFRSDKCGNGTWTRSAGYLPQCYGGLLAGGQSCTPPQSDTCTWTGSYTWDYCPPESHPISEPANSTYVSGSGCHLF